MADELSVGSVSVDVVPDTTNFRRDLAAKLKGITANVAVSADVDRAREEIDEAAHDRDTTIDANADTTRADEQIDRAARDRTSTIKVNTLGGEGVSGIAATVLGLGPALIPVTAAVVGLTAALAAPIATAAGGLGVGALLAGAFIKQTTAANKQIGTLAKQVATAKLAVQNASTPATKKTAQATLAADTFAYKNALQQLTPAQKKFIAAQAGVKVAFQKLTTAAGGAILGPVTKGLKLLSSILPKLKPIIMPVSKALDGLLSDIAGFTKTPGFKEFLQGFGKEAGAAITSFGSIFGKFGLGLINLFAAFAPLSKNVVAGLDGLATSFVRWSSTLSTNQGFQKFLAYIKSVGPKVLSVFGQLVKLIVNLGIDLAPLGGIILGFVGGVAKFLNNAKPGTINAIAIAVGGLALAFGKGPLGLAFAVGAVLAHSSKFTDFLKKAGDLAQQFGKWFDKLPAGIQAAAAAAVGVGAVAGKLGLLKIGGGSNGLGGKTGGLLGLFSKAKPVPVYVTNEGFGGTGVGVPGAEGKPGFIGSAVKKLATIAPAAGAYALPFGFTLLLYKEGQNQNPKAAPTNIDPGVARGGNAARQFYADKATQAAQAAATQKVKDYSGSIDNMRVRVDIANKQVGKLARAEGQIPPKVTTNFNLEGLTKAQQYALSLKSIYDGLNGRVVTTTIRARQQKNDRELYGAGGVPVGATGGIVTRPTVALIGEKTPEAVVPLNQTAGSSPLPSTLGGGPQRITLDVGGGRTLTGWIQTDSYKGAVRREKSMAIGGVSI